jgi:exonuclease III
MKIFEWLKGKKQDIIYLQETHSAKEDEIKWKKRMGR